MKTPSNPWLDLSLDAARLTYESSHVIGLRLALAARGGMKAQTEAALMVSEKAQAAFDAQFMVAKSVMSGEAHLVPARTVALYRDRVQANHRRLTRRG
jgi:hypothetical protein